MPQNQLNVNRNVVRDLLPVYLAGEASRDTRALVEAFLEQDPVLRAEAEAARSMGGGLPPVVPPDAVEARALAQTQSFVRQRSAWMGAAIAFTILPHSFAFKGDRLTFLLYRDIPWLAGAAIVAAIAAWGMFFRTCARMAATGLQPPKTRTLPLVWALSAFVFATILLWPVSLWAGRNLTIFAPVAAAVAGWLATRWKQIPAPEERNHSRSLFDR